MRVSFSFSLFASCVILKRFRLLLDFLWYFLFPSSFFVFEREVTSSLLLIPVTPKARISFTFTGFIIDWHSSFIVRIDEDSNSLFLFLFTDIWWAKKRVARDVIKDMQSTSRCLLYNCNIFWQKAFSRNLYASAIKRKITRKEQPLRQRKRCVTRKRVKQETSRALLVYYIHWRLRWVHSSRGDTQFCRLTLSITWRMNYPFPGINTGREDEERMTWMKREERWRSRKEQEEAWKEEKRQERD